LLAQKSAAAHLARLLVVLAGAQFLLHPTPFDQLLESAKSQTDGFPIVNPHPQTHSTSTSFGELDKKPQGVPQAPRRELWG
jgi:hypothetical protein